MIFEKLVFRFCILCTLTGGNALMQRSHFTHEIFAVRVRFNSCQFFFSLCPLFERMATAIVQTLKDSAYLPPAYVNRMFAPKVMKIYCSRLRIRLKATTLGYSITILSAQPQMAKQMLHKTTQIGSYENREVETWLFPARLKWPEIRLSDATAIKSIRK